jgi:hypothetical protein
MAWTALLALVLVAPASLASAATRRYTLAWMPTPPSPLEDADRRCAVAFLATPARPRGNTKVSALGAPVPPLTSPVAVPLRVGT